MIIRTIIVLCVTLLVASTIKEYDFAVKAADKASGSNNAADKGNNAIVKGSRPLLTNLRSNMVPSLWQGSFLVATREILNQPNTALLENHLSKYSKTSKLKKTQILPSEQSKNKATTAPTSAPAAAKQAVTFTLVDHTISNNNNDASAKQTPAKDSDSAGIFGYIKDSKVDTKMRHFINKLSFHSQKGSTANMPLQSKMPAKACKKEFFEAAQVKTITLSRHPVMPGTTLDVTISGNFKIPIRAGSVIQITNQMDSLHYDVVLDLCKQSLVHGTACPIYPGEQNIKLSLSIPTSLPSGIFLDVTFKGISTGGLTLFCATLDDIMIDYPSISAHIPPPSTLITSLSAPSITSST